MRRIIYLLAFFAGVMLALRPAWGMVIRGPETAVETAQAAASEQMDSGRPRKAETGARPPLYRPSLRPDGHLKIKPAVSRSFSSPFDEARQSAGGKGITAGAAGLRLTGLVRSSRGVRAVIEQGQKVIALREGETKSGITLREIDEESRTVLVHGPFGERVLSLSSSPP